jgi:deoxyribonuclease-4
MGSREAAGELLLGAHVSVAGGFARAVERAAQLGASALQLFTKQPNRWHEPGIEPQEGRAFRQQRRVFGIRFAAAHDSYLINLASPDRVLWARSLLSFVSELRRCEILGLDALVSHPGNYLDHPQAGLERNAGAVALALRAVPGRTRLLLEMTAGSGTALGATFEDMAALLALLPSDVARRVGVCLDTAHLVAAGYDLVRRYESVWEEFDQAIGFARLGLLHLNDSKAPLGSRRDRHELIGQGTLGEGVFRRLMTDPRLAGVPKIIETPKLDDPMRTDRRMLERLRRYAGGPSAPQGVQRS